MDEAAAKMLEILVQVNGNLLHKFVDRLTDKRPARYATIGSCLKYNAPNPTVYSQ